MKQPLPPLCILLFLFLFASVTACKKDYLACYGPFHIINDTLVEMEGDMGGRVEKQFAKVLDKYPGIKLVIMKECPGSRDDVSMMEAARLLKSHSINTHLAETGKIESGAVDLFLYGGKKTPDMGGQFGGEGWSDGGKEATDFPNGHEEHLLYISYYKEMGWSHQEAEDLYFFIINAATADGMHWMTEQEILQYEILSP